MSKPRLTVHRFYKGLSFSEVIEIWTQALLSREFGQGVGRLERMPRRTVEKPKLCVYGVLCRSLDLPRKVVVEPNGIVLGYKDAKLSADEADGEYVTDRLPEHLHRFLVSPGRHKLGVNMSAIANLSPVIFSRISSETELDRKTLTLMEPTFGRLNDLGVSFNTLAILIRTNYW